MALSCQVVDFVGLDFLDEAYQRAGIGHVAIMEIEQPASLHVAHPLVEIEVLDATRVETAATAHHAVHLIALIEKKLGQVGAILPGDTGD